MNECFKLYKAAHACTKGPKFVRPLAGVFRHLSQLLFACHIGSHAEIGEGCLSSTTVWDVSSPRKP